MPEAKFKVLEEEKARELTHLKRASSHLALGVFYAREGMAAEDEKDFQILVDSNPQSSIPQMLPRTISNAEQKRRICRDYPFLYPDKYRRAIPISLR